MIGKDLTAALFERLLYIFGCSTLPSVLIYVRECFHMSVVLRDRVCVCVYEG